MLCFFVQRTRNRLARLLRLKYTDGKSVNVFLHRRIKTQNAFLLLFLSKCVAPSIAAVQKERTTKCLKETYNMGRFLSNRDLWLLGGIWDRTYVCRTCSMMLRFSSVLMLLGCFLVLFKRNTIIENQQLSFYFFTVGIFSNSVSLPSSSSSWLFVHHQVHHITQINSLLFRC